MTNEQSRAFHTVFGTAILKKDSLLQRHHFAPVVFIIVVMENIPLRRRIGTFFILVALFLFVLFVGAIIAQSESWPAYFFSGVISLVLGFLLQRGTAPPPQSNRFSGIRKLKSNLQKKKR